MSFKRKTIRRAIALMMVMLTAVTVNCTASKSVALAASVTKGNVNVRALNVRKGPGVENAIINVIHKGDTVEIVKTVNGWHRITQGKNKFGWVSANYIDSGKAKKNALVSASPSSKTASVTKKNTSVKTNGIVTVTGSYTNSGKEGFMV